MKTTTSLCFSSEGLLNPESVNFLLSKEVDTVVFFTDGSEAAYQQMCNFDVSNVQDKIKHFAIGKLPLYDMRVISPDGSLSKPNYVINEDVKIKWICSKICPHYLKISISDITSQSETQVQLDTQQTELVCYLAYQLWSMMLQAEDKLCFPAIVIDRMTRWTYQLTPETIDIKYLKNKINLETLEYNSVTDLLSVSIGEEVFSVKLSVLNSFYGEFILPIFNSIFGRRLRILVSVSGSTGQFCDPVDMSYGELGRLIEDLRSFTKETPINSSTPMDAQDLLTFAKKVKINEESCIWKKGDQTFLEFFDSNLSILVRECSDHNNTNKSNFEERAEEAVE